VVVPEQPALHATSGWPTSLYLFVIVLIFTLAAYNTYCQVAGYTRERTLLTADEVKEASVNCG
jgi:hypothetical protein